MKKELIELEAKNQETSLLAAATPGEIEEDVVLQCQILQLLLNKKITTFHFPTGLNLDSQANANALWQALVDEQPPDLHTIVKRCRDDGTTPWNMEAFLLSMLGIFPDLQVLRLEHFVCDDSHLCKIAEHQPKLRYFIFNVIIYILIVSCIPLIFV